MLTHLRICTPTRLDVYMSSCLLSSYRNLWRRAAPEVYVQLSEDPSDSQPVAADTYDDDVTGAGMRKPAASEETAL